MFHTIYYEEEIADHPLVQNICSRYPTLPQTSCHRYTEIFNRKAQNFRLQKQAPALILAKKFNGFVLKTPEGYGIGEELKTVVDFLSIRRHNVTLCLRFIVYMSLQKG